MRWILAVWIGGWFLTGCATQQSEGNRAPRTIDATQARPGGRPASPAEATRPALAPDEFLLGKVASVHPTLRFVVMDFPVRKMPALGQRLNLYRDGQKVGEVKVSGPALDTTIAGDIVAGEAQIGDEVRED